MHEYLGGLPLCARRKFYATNLSSFQAYLSLDMGVFYRFSLYLEVYLFSSFSVFFFSFLSIGEYLLYLNLIEGP